MYVPNNRSDHVRKAFWVKMNYGFSVDKTGFVICDFIKSKFNFIHLKNINKIVFVHLLRFVCEWA